MSTALKLRKINEIRLSEITTAEIKMIPNSNLQQAVYHLKSFFDAAKFGNILFNGKECNFYYAFRKDEITVADVAEKLKTIDSLHYSLSLFRGFKRQYSEALSNSGTTIDLDYYNVPELSSLTPEAVVEKMNSEGLFDDPAVRPNYFVSSGGGLYLIYLMKNINVNPRQDHDLKKATVQQNIEKRREITKALIRHFEEYGSDNKCHDLTRINKLPGIVNLKNGNTTRILDFDKVINTAHKPRTLGHWYNHLVEKGYIVEEPIKKSKKKSKHINTETRKDRAEKNKNIKVNSNKKKANIDKRKEFKNTHRKNGKEVVLWNAHSLNIARIEDLQTLLRLRYNKPFEGARNQFLWIYSCLLRLITDDLEEIRETIIKTNSSFVDPQPNSDLRSLLTQIENDELTYLFKNSTIIQELNITDEEQRELKAIISKTEVKRRNSALNNIKNKHKRRDEQELTQTEQSKLTKLAAVERMLKRNLPVSEIAKRLKIKKRRAYELVEELKNL